MMEWENKYLEKAFEKKMPLWHENFNNNNPPGPKRFVKTGQECPECNNSSVFCCCNKSDNKEFEGYVSICVNTGACDYAVAMKFMAIELPDCAFCDESQ